MEFEEWFSRVVLIVERLYKIEEDDLPKDFFKEAYVDGMHPRQAVMTFQEIYL